MSGAGHHQEQKDGVGVTPPYALHKAAPFKIKTLMPDSGREFTDRAFGRHQKDARGEHEFDALYQALGIEHRLTMTKHPQTNRMVERFNG